LELRSFQLAVLYPVALSHTGAVHTAFGIAILMATSKESMIDKHMKVDKLMKIISLILIFEPLIAYSLEPTIVCV
jgi:hypothetical protein